MKIIPINKSSVPDGEDKTGRWFRLKEYGLKRGTLVYQKGRSSITVQIRVVWNGSFHDALHEVEAFVCVRGRKIKNIFSAIRRMVERLEIPPDTNKRMYLRSLVRSGD